jgi:CRISPR-associated endonuclease/helicase Cas3
VDYPLAERALGFVAHLENEREQLLRNHLLAVSQSTRRHAEKIGIGAAGATIGLLHDLGKYSRAFQDYLRRMALNQDTEQQDPERGKIDHSTAGAQTIWRDLKAQGVLEGIVGEILAICVASHHSGLIDCITPSGLDNLSRRIDKADAESHFAEAWASAEQQVSDEHRKHLVDASLVGGLRDIVNRICQLDRNRGIRQFKVGLLVRCTSMNSRRRRRG